MHWRAGWEWGFRAAVPWCGRFHGGHKSGCGHWWVRVYMEGEDTPEVR